MKRIRKLFAIGSLLLLGLIYNVANGQTTVVPYYIDTEYGVDPQTTDVNTGTDINNPVKTLNGLDPSAFTSGNKEFLILRGASTNPRLTLSDITGVITNGTWTINHDNIKIGSYDGGDGSLIKDPIIETTLPNNGQAVIDISNKTNIVIEKIGLWNLSSAGACIGIKIDGENTSDIMINKVTISYAWNNILESGIVADGGNSAGNPSGSDLTISGCELVASWGGRCINIKDYINVNVENSYTWNGWPGMYFEDIESHSTEENTLTLSGCHIRGNFSADYGVEIKNCDYAIIENSSIFGNITSSNDPIQYGLIVSSSNNLKMTKCDIYNIERNGITFSNSDNIILEECSFEDIDKETDTNGDDLGFYYGITTQPNVGDFYYYTGNFIYLLDCDNFLIRNNEFLNPNNIECENFIRIDGSNTDNGTIYNNEFNGNSTIENSIYLGEGNYKISNNYIEGSNYGIFTIDNLTSSGVEVDIHHNIILDCAGRGVELNDYAAGNVYHNNIVNDEALSSYTAIDIATSCSNCTTYVKNNIVDISNQSGNYAKALDISSPANVCIEYNAFTNLDYDTNNETCVQWGTSTVYEVIDDYIAAQCSTSLCSTFTSPTSISFTGSPFSDILNGDFTPTTASGCIDAGYPINGYNTDFNLNWTPAGCYNCTTKTDIGAIEYYAPVTTDWSTASPEDWYYATPDLVTNHPGHKVGNIYHDEELVYLRGVNYYGFGLSGEEVFLNLNLYGIDDLLEKIKELGYNAIRLCYTADVIKNQIDDPNSNVNLVSSNINFNDDITDPALGNEVFWNTIDNEPVSKFKAMQAIVSKCEAKGIYVVLANLGIEGGNGRWYKNDGSFTEEEFLAGLYYVAANIQNSNVVGIDIINEPAADWNDSDDKDNFRRFAQSAGYNLRTIRPEWLIFIEGVQFYSSAFNAPNFAKENDIISGVHSTIGSAESLSAYDDNGTNVEYWPIETNIIPTHKLVLSPHTYQYSQDYFTSNIDLSGSVPTVNQNITDLNDFRWGYLAENYALIPGEFGCIYPNETSYILPAENQHGKTWMTYFVNYIAEKKLPGSFYWAINGNTSYITVDPNNTPTDPSDDVDVLSGLLEADWDDHWVEKNEDYAVMFSRVSDKFTDPLNDFIIYSPRDGTTYTFPAQTPPNTCLNMLDIVSHTGHWAGEDYNGTNPVKYASDVLDAKEELGHLKSILHEFEVSCIDVNGAEVSSALKEFTISVVYTDEELGSVNEDYLSFYKYTSNGWDQLDLDEITHDKTNNTITLTTQDFGIYAVLGLGEGAPESQSIELLSGWSYWSSYTLTLDQNFNSVFSSYLNDIIIMKSGDGSAFWPTYGLNEIGEYVIGEGYQANMTTAQTFTIEGYKVNPASHPVDIPSGWSIIGYLRTTAMDIELVFTNVASNIIIVKNELGQNYWPDWGVDQIGDMLPDEGYQINTSSQITGFIFPAPGTKQGLIGNTNSSSIYKTYTQDIYVNTDNNMTIGIPESAWQTTMTIGDEVAVLGESGQLVGKSIYKGGFTAITVYGDDYYTPNVVENLADGESFTLQVYSSLNKSKKNFVFKNWENGDGTFCNNSIDIVSLKEVEELDEELEIAMDLYPNPNKGNFILKVASSKTQAISIKVYDLKGILVYSNEFSIDKGDNQIKLDLSTLKPESYTMRVSSEKNTKQMKLIIVD